jgi:hypothetical protein
MNPAWPLADDPQARPLQEGGQGLRIIRQVFAAADYRREGDENVLRLEARFPLEAPHGRDATAEETTCPGPITP